MKPSFPLSATGILMIASALLVGCNQSEETVSVVEVSKDLHVPLGFNSSDGD